MNIPHEDAEREGHQAAEEPQKINRSCLGCLGLLFLFCFGPALLMVMSDFVHIIGLGLAGLLGWFLIATAFRKKMWNPLMILVGMLLMGGLVTLGVLMPVISFLPCPSWCSRQVVKKSDYRAMESIFGHALPASFRISQIHYPGYNLIFNGPDGPLAAEYEAILNRFDLNVLMAKAAKEEVTKKEGEWPAFGYQSKHLLERFGNDWPAKYDKERWDQKMPKVPKAYWIKDQGDRINSLVTVDDRSSSTVRLYVYTRVPYAM